MRSFIKSHRRNESVNSETLDSPDGFDYFARSTPGNSPSILQGPQLTPPQAITSSSNGSISSPKKLLTPIKNLFSHSSKNLALSTTADSLNNAIYNSSKSSKKAKSHKRASHSISNVSDFLTDASLHSTASYLSSTSQPVLEARLDSVSETTSTQQPSLAPPPSMKPSSLHQQPLPHNHFHHSHSSTSLSSVARGARNLVSPMSVSRSTQSLSQLSSSNEISHTPPELIAHKTNLDKRVTGQKLEADNQTNNQSTELVKVNKTDEGSKVVSHESGGVNKLVSFKSLEYGKRASADSGLKSPYDLRKVDNNSDIEENDTLEADDDDDESDSSSQFSFVKDKIGGRNTSVKYYKAAKSTPPTANDSVSNTFHEGDLGYEVDEYSDYDYENNGMDDDYDYEDENQGDEHYNKLFDDEDLDRSNNINDDVDSLTDGHYEAERPGKETYDDDENYDDYDNYDDLEEEIPSRVGGIDDDDAPHSEFQFQVNDNDEDYYHNHISTIEELTEIVDPEDVAVETPPSTDDLLHLPSYPLPKQFNKAFHLSIQGFPTTPPTFSSKSIESVDESDINTDDILENYLDFSKLPSVTHGHSTSSLDAPATELSNSDYLQLYDLSSPIINGLTIGNNLDHRYPRRGNSQRDSSSKRDFYNLTSNIHIKPLSSDKPDRDVFKRRILRSFHSSLSDDLNYIIPEKVSSMELVSNRIIKVEEPFPVANATQKGSETTVASSELSKSINTSVPSKATARLSIIEMMDLLGSLETNNTAVDQSDLKESKRLSISNMMSFLSSIETNQEPKLASTIDKETRDHNRRSIADMMATLSVLESNTSDGTNEAKRKSITHMMNLLSRLDDENEKYEFKETVQPEKKSKNPIVRLNLEKVDNTKRYSWFNNDEMINFKSKDSLAKPVPVYLTDEELDEANNYQLDQELLDEVNQLPEDFDFEEHELQKKLQKPAIDLGFYRSNSYNKKPIRAIIDNNFSSNKIETMNKTVTFYRSNSSGHVSELNKSRSISRAPSSRSMMSFGSLNEEDSSEEQEYPHPSSTSNETLNRAVQFRDTKNLLQDNIDSSGCPLGTITESSPLRQ